MSHTTESTAGPKLSVASTAAIRADRPANLFEYLLIAGMLLLGVAWVMHEIGSPFRFMPLDTIRNPIIIFFGPLATVGLGLLLAAAVFSGGAFRRYLPATLVAIKRLLELGILVSAGFIVATFVEWHDMRHIPMSASINSELLHIALLVVARLLVGRHANGLLAVASVVFTLALTLYLADRYLAFTNMRALVAHYERVYGRPIDEIDLDLERANSLDWTWGHRVDYNNLGFRSADVEAEKPAGTRRIMVLGDSLTWGAGLAVDQRYTELLQTRLQHSQPGNRWQVANFGLAGGPTVTEAEILAEHLDHVQPDFIIVGYCVNDPQPLPQNHSVERTDYYWLHNLVASLRHIGMTDVQKLLHTTLDGVLVRFGLIPSSDDALDRSYQPDSRNWQAFLAALDDIYQLSTEAGAGQPIFALLPQGIASDHPHHPYLSRWFDLAGAAAKDAGFIVVDPRPDFVARMKLDELMVNPFDAHPSIASNVLYADALHAALEVELRKRRAPAVEQEASSATVER
ncbi:MAG: hypothetical protein KDI82_00335 [Gammaproteobacteria bacterium]|nr:hypothetical protein [Gammaproteobacteria bacterium]